jgi:hypothetical protein
MRTRLHSVLRIGVFIVLFCLVVSTQAQTSNEKIPFGPLSEVDMDQLIKFGRARGFDLQPELERVYKKDEQALTRLFLLSLKFKKFDRNVRAYGQVIYSCFTKYGEIDSVDFYLKILDRQSAEVQQRVRDLLYYPLLRVPKEQRKENREEIGRMYPRLFPPDFQFGRNDPMF